MDATHEEQEQGERIRVVPTLRLHCQLPHQKTNPPDKQRLLLHTCRYSFKTAAAAAVLLLLLLAPSCGG